MDPAGRKSLESMCKPTFEYLHLVYVPPSMDDGEDVSHGFLQRQICRWRGSSSGQRPDMVLNLIPTMLLCNQPPDAASLTATSSKVCSKRGSLAYAPSGAT